MDDLVERLLAWSEHAEVYGSKQSRNAGKLPRLLAEAATRIQALETSLAEAEGRVKEARRQALEEAAKVADEAHAEHKQSGLTHPEDSESRGRCFARARAAMYIAQAIRALASEDSPSPPPVV